MKAWREAYRASPPPKKMLVSSIVWMYRGDAEDKVCTGDTTVYRFALAEQGWTTARSGFVKPPVDVGRDGWSREPAIGHSEARDSSGHERPGAFRSGVLHESGLLIGVERTSS